MHNVFCEHRICRVCFDERYAHQQNVLCCWPGCHFRFQSWMFVWDNEPAPAQPPGLTTQAQSTHGQYASPYQQGDPDSATSAHRPPPQAHYGSHEHHQAQLPYGPPQAGTSGPVQAWHGQHSAQPSFSPPQSSAGFTPDSSRKLEVRQSHDSNMSTDRSFEMHQYYSSSPTPYSPPPVELARQDSPPGPGNLSRAPTLFGHRWENHANHLTHHIPTCMYRGEVMGPLVESDFPHDTTLTNSEQICRKILHMPSRAINESASLTAAFGLSSFMTYAASLTSMLIP